MTELTKGTKFSIGDEEFTLNHVTKKGNGETKILATAVPKADSE